MGFTFGAAKRLYERNIHPRVLIGPEDIAAIRRQIQSGPAGKIMRVLRRRVALVIGRVLNATDLPSTLAQWNSESTPLASPIVWGLHDTAMAGILDANPDAIEAVRRVLAALPMADALARQPVGRLYWGMDPHTLLAFDLLHGLLGVEERRAFADWVVEQPIRAMLLRRWNHFFRGAGANLPIDELLNGLMGLLAVRGEPGIPELDDELRRMLLMFEAALNAALGPDGYPTEDIGYGSVMGARLAYVVEAVRRAGLYDAYRACPRFAKFGRAMLHFAQPWGEALSNTGDHGDDFAERNFVLARLAAETRDPSLLWLLGTLTHPTALSGPRDPQRDFWEEAVLPGHFRAPANALALMTASAFTLARHPSQSNIPTQYVDRGRGIAVFRSSWRDDATFVVFDGAQRPAAAPGHAHDSGGHFSLSALGEYFAIDTGRYNIEQDQHNVALVDGKSGRATGGEWRMSYYHATLTGYRPGEFVDAAAVDSSHQHNCYWARRHLGLVKGEIPYVWIVDDVNFANDCRQYWWQLHTHPDNRIVLRKGVATIHGCRRGNLLDVHFALPDPKAYPKPHTLELAQDQQSCGSSQYIGQPGEKARLYRRLVGDLVHGPVFQRPRLLAKISGFNGRFMSILIPRRKGEQPATVERLPSIDNSLAVRITFAKVVDTLIWAYEHHLLEAGGIVGRGNWCVVRRDRRTGQALAWEMADGHDLRVEGKSLLMAGRRTAPPACRVSRRMKTAPRIPLRQTPSADRNLILRL